MKITAEGGGGFAGMVQRYEVDTRISPAGPALEAAVAAGGLLDAPEPPEVIGADLPRWTLTLLADGRQRTLHFTEDTPSPWLDLLNLLRAAG